MMDRSVCALRTLRPELDGGIFWFRDDLHQPCPISPMGMTTVQKHHAWGYHVAAEQTQLPPSHGAYVKIYKGRVYLGFVQIDDPAEIERRAAKFSALVDRCKLEWDAYYGGYIDEVKAGLAELDAIDADALSHARLLEHLQRTDDIDRRNWEIHFILMYPADAIYLEFEQFCKDRGLDEPSFVPMLCGFESKPAETDEQMWRLAQRARSGGVESVLCSGPASGVRSALGAIAPGRAWLEELDAFLEVYGNRINAAHLDVLYPTWKEDPTPVIETIRGYFRRMDEGWDLAANRRRIVEQRQAAVAAFEASLPEADRPAARRLLEVAQKVYAYQEDHGFYIDQGSTAALRRTLMACGRRLCSLGLIPRADDVLFLTLSTLVEVLGDLARNESVAIYHHKAQLESLLGERKQWWSETAAMQAPLTVGKVPEKMNDPIAIKVFGIIDEVLHPQGEMRIAQRLEGFAASHGVVEGTARVVMQFDGFADVQAGDILVCPYTGTAWTPLFLKIAGVVTDTGGMLTHAAIAAREYGIPAVVGTWNATRSIRDGDRVRIDGSAGVVEILDRVA